MGVPLFRIQGGQSINIEGGVRGEIRGRFNKYVALSNHPPKKAGKRICTNTAGVGLRVGRTPDPATLKLSKIAQTRYGILTMEIKTSKWGKVSALEQVPFVPLAPCERAWPDFADIQFAGLPSTHLGKRFFLVKTLPFDP